MAYSPALRKKIDDCVFSSLGWCSISLVTGPFCCVQRVDRTGRGQKAPRIRAAREPPDLFSPLLLPACCFRLASGFSGTPPTNPRHGARFRHPPRPPRRHRAAPPRGLLLRRLIDPVPPRRRQGRLAPRLVPSRYLVNPDVVSSAPTRLESLGLCFWQKTRIWVVWTYN